MNRNLAIFVAILLAGPALAGQFSLYEENDVPYHHDALYTQGARVQYVGNNDIGGALGQNMYTPADLRDPARIPGDRPYCGYLYGSVFNTSYRENGDELFGELQVGCVGPASLAEETQKQIHTCIGSTVPLGWDNQVPDHLTVLAIGRYTFHMVDSQYFAIDPYIGAQVGNLADNFTPFGVNVYAGYHLPAKRNAHRVIPLKADCSIWNRVYAYAWGGIDPHTVLYNMTLQQPGYDIHPYMVIYDQNLGVVLGLGRYELAFTLCRRAREFKEQPEAEQFGSIKLSVSL